MQVNDCAIDEFLDFIRNEDFPCVGAKSAQATHGVQFVVANDMRESDSDGRILTALRRMPYQPEPSQGLIATVALFPNTPFLPEATFERHLWSRLQALYDADRRDFRCDPRVSADPASPHFGMSIGGSGYFVVGMHPRASRKARRAPMTALAFNPHAQFQRLKDEMKYDRMRTIVRQRDVAIQGDLNPMLADRGTKSEAAQYSGRAVTGEWVCPFQVPPGVLS